jgi:hypothetical protein
MKNTPQHLHSNLDLMTMCRRPQGMCEGASTADLPDLTKPPLAPLRPGQCILLAQEDMLPLQSPDIWLVCFTTCIALVLLCNVAADGAAFASTTRLNLFNCCEWLLSTRSELLLRYIELHWGKVALGHRCALMVLGGLNLRCMLGVDSWSSQSSHYDSFT